MPLTFCQNVLYSLETNLLVDNSRKPLLYSGNLFINSILESGKEGL